MDAIFSSMSRDEPRKKKRRLSEKDEAKTEVSTASKKAEKIPAESESADNSMEAEQQQNEGENEDVKEEKPTFSFYRDTLETPTEEDKKKSPPRQEEAKKNEDLKADDANDEDEKMEQDPDDPIIEDKVVEEEELEFQEPDHMPREVKGILVYHRGINRQTKTITWRAEADLVSVSYFELDEDERVNVNKVKFENMREFESKMEKAALKSKITTEDEMDDDSQTNDSFMPWRKPVPILVDNREPFVPGSTSREKEIQADREKNVLQALYFTKETTPNTPGEAEIMDSDAVRNTNEDGPTVIPLEDKEAAGDENSDFDYTSKGWPEPKVNQVSQQASFENVLSLPPALSSLLSKIENSGFQAIFPPPQSLSKEDQNTLAAQTQAMKAMGILPGIDIPPTFPPPAQKEGTKDNNASAVAPPTNNGNGAFPGAPPPGYPPPPFPNMVAPPPTHGLPPRGVPPPHFPLANGFHGGFGPPPNYAFPTNGRGGFRPVGPGYRTGPPPPGMRDFHNHRGGGVDNRDNRRRDFDRDDRSKIGTRPCKFFASRGTCRDGDRCRYIHEQPPRT